jgi:hypothetical protein
MTRGSSRAIWVDDSVAVPPRSVHNFQVMAAQLTGLQHQAIRLSWLELFCAASSSTAVEGQPMPRYFRDLAALRTRPSTQPMSSPRKLHAYLDCRWRLLSELVVVCRSIHLTPVLRFVGAALTS